MVRDNSTATLAHSGQPRVRSGLIWAAGLLGFALGGFADGILFHQILQWHHLLSTVGGVFGDLRMQVLADGVFHIAMYVLMAIGLLLLWRARGSFLAETADRLFFAALLVGFGFWHIVDAVFSHWLLGIHHIRMESDNVLLWDLLVFVFGLIAMALGFWIAGHRPRARPVPIRTPGTLPAVLVALVIGSGVVAARSPQDGPTTILFKPGTDASAAFAAIVDAEARPVWSDPDQPTLWVVDIEDARLPALYKRGVVLSSRSAFAAGCFSALARR
jgi:uncharacterized membrane protein